MAGENTYYIGRGSKFTSRLKLYDDNKVEIDLSDYTAKLVVKRNANEDAILTKNPTISGNEINIVLLKADTELLINDEYEYYLEVYKVDNEPLDLMYGKIVMRSR